MDRVIPVRVVPVREITAKHYKKEAEQRLSKLKRSIEKPLGDENFELILNEIRETENFIRGI